MQQRLQQLLLQWLLLLQTGCHDPSCHFQPVLLLPPGGGLCLGLVHWQAMHPEWRCSGWQARAPAQRTQQWMYVAQAMIQLSAVSTVVAVLL